MNIMKSKGITTMSMIYNNNIIINPLGIALLSSSSCNLISIARNTNGRFLSSSASSSAATGSSNKYENLSAKEKTMSRKTREKESGGNLGSRKGKKMTLASKIQLKALRAQEAETAALAAASSKTRMGLSNQSSSSSKLSSPLPSSPLSNENNITKEKDEGTVTTTAPVTSTSIPIANASAENETKTSNITSSSSNEKNEKSLDTKKPVENKKVLKPKTIAPLAPPQAIDKLLKLVTRDGKKNNTSNAEVGTKMFVRSDFNPNSVNPQ